MSDTVTLNQIRPGDRGVIVKVCDHCHHEDQAVELERRLLELGFVEGARIEVLHEGLFGPRPACEAIIGEENGEVVAFALFFHNFSTFLTRKGLYLEDLYVRQSHRGKGYGTALLARLAQRGERRGISPALGEAVPAEAELVRPAS